MRTRARARRRPRSRDGRYLALSWSSGTKLLRENRALLEARKSTESRTIPKFRDLGLARLERSSSGHFGYEAGGALGTGGGQGSKDLPGSRAFLGFVTTGDLAGDDRRAQLAFG